MKKLFWSKWKVSRPLYPVLNKEMFGVYREHRFTGEIEVFDTGLTEKVAQIVCDELNNKQC